MVPSHRPPDGTPVGRSYVHSTQSPPARSQVSAAATWTRGYWEDHPKRSLETFGRQITMGIQAIVELVVDLFRRQFPWREFIKQCGFMASVSAAPTLLVAIPIGVVVSIQVGSIAGQVGVTSFIGA